MRFFQNILLIAGLITGNMLFAQNRIVKGTVTDLEDGSPIIGAGVMSGKNQTATDLEGRFSISVEPGERLIRFNEIGYYTVTLVIPDSQDTEMAVSLRQTVILDMWNRPLSEKKLLSYSPNVNLDLPDVHRIKVQTRRFVPKKKLVRAIYGKKPYYTAISVLFEDKNGNTIHQKESKMMVKRLKATPVDIIEIKGFLPVWIDNSSDTPTYYLGSNTKRNRGEEFEPDGLFHPLSLADNRAHELTREKARNWDRAQHPSWLRIYAIRIEPNVYIVTGGAIKLTATMQEREHTQKELDKLNACRDFLKQNGVFDQDSFVDFFEEE